MNDKFINPLRGVSMAGANVARADAINKLFQMKPLNNTMQALLHTDRLHDMFKSYMQKLTDDGRMLRLSEIKKMDILDTTGILPPPDDGYSIPSFGRANEKEKEAIRKLGWYAGIPCFEKGALKLNKFRYIVFEVLEIDPEDKSAKINIRDYSKQDGQIWQIGVGATIIIGATGIKDETGDEHFYRAEIIDRENFEDIYTLYSANELHWTESDYTFWNDTIVKHSQITTDSVRQRSNGLDQCDSLVNLFVLIISRCNAMLEMNKPSRPVKKDMPKSTSVKRKTAYEKGAEPERKIRYVGTLRVQSQNVPRKPCFETVVTYKVAKWNVRGHVRHYKNGKDVYIKPGTRTRKALEGSDKTTATTIRFRKKKG